MKKILIIILLFAGFNSFSQTVIRPAKDYILGSDTTNLSDSLRLAWTTKLQLSDSAGNFITPYDTSLTHNWIENYFIKFSDSTGIFITPYDTILLSSRIGLLEALNLLNDTDYVHSTVADTIWGSNLVFSKLGQLIKLNYDMVGNDFGLSYNFSSGENSLISAIGDVEYFHGGLLTIDTSYTSIGNSLSVNDSIIVGNVAKMYDNSINFVIDSDNPVTLNNELKLVNPSANYISSATALDITTSFSNSIVSIDSTQTQFYENVFFEKTIVTDSSIIITDLSGADSSVLLVDATNFIIDNDNPIKITNTPVTATADSIYVVEDGILKKQKAASITADTFQVFRTDSLYVNDFININGLQAYSGVYTLLDDGSIVLPASTAGFGTVQIGDNQALINFSWTTTGVVTSHYTNGATALTDSDTFFCVFDSGSTVTIKNRLAATLKLRVNLCLSTN